LVIGHFSARYTNPFVLLREARDKFFPAWLATELRPIYTNPSQEKGIVQQKVYIKEASDSSGGGGKGKKKRSRSSDKSKKRFRKRKSSSSDRKKRSRSSSSSSDRRRKRSDRNRNDNNDNQSSSRSPKHITPRTPFDNFDRF